MEINLEFEQDFVKKGKGISKYGGADFGAKGPRDIKSDQIDKLKVELQKYDITENRRYKIASEIESLNSVEYMNMKYLAAVIMMFEEYNGSYQDEDNVNAYLYDILNDKNRIKFFINKVADIDNEKDNGYIKLVKSILWSYAYKLFTNRKNGYNF
jgi:hypothetical protein